MAGSALHLHRVHPDNMGDAEAVFEELGTYSTHVDGCPRRPEAAYDFATELPPGRDARHKHAFVAYRDDLPIGLLDIVEGYPAPSIAFIGLLAVKERLHGKGIGRQLYTEAERLARQTLRARTIRLAVVEANPVMGFWRKMGFEPTGEVKPYLGQNVRSRVILLEKPLLAPDEERLQG
ncbi:GNAT family N-acetyltransferase [Afifella aestuarii]|uniref:GNAT family N-acetyltransferase n=1 Tax=Afifella aestuarii TaxID=1909496 RepID=UPI000FE372B6|nr:GNAT family N-acetyltransferase [Afifella aestuarii]